MPKHNFTLAIFLLGCFATALIALHVVKQDEVLSTTIRYLIEDSTADHGNKNLMLGSSSIKILGEHDFLKCGPWLNRGIGTSKISSLNRYLNWSRLAVSPSLVLVYAGENDISAGMSSTEVVDQYKSLIAKLNEKFPSSDIHIIAIKPSPRRKSVWEGFKVVNSMMQVYVSDLQGLFFHSSPLSDKEFFQSGFLDDGIHLTDLGYSLFTSGFNKVCATQ